MIVTSNESLPTKQSGKVESFDWSETDNLEIAECDGNEEMEVEGTSLITGPKMIVCEIGLSEPL